MLQRVLSQEWLRSSAFNCIYSSFIDDMVNFENLEWECIGEIKWGLALTDGVNDLLS